MRSTGGKRKKGNWCFYCYCYYSSIPKLRKFTNYGIPEFGCKKLRRNAFNLVDFAWFNRFKINCRNGIALFIFFLWGTSDAIPFLQLWHRRGLPSRSLALDKTLRCTIAPNPQNSALSNMHRIKNHTNLGLNLVFQLWSNGQVSQPL